MPNAYISLATFKATAGLDIQSTVYDGRLRKLLENISQEVNRYTDRYFYFTNEVRFFSGNGTAFFPVPDLIALPGSAILEDTQSNGTFSTVWGSLDYVLAPYNANPTGTWDARPYRKIEVNTKSNGTQDVFEKGQRNYSITGTWGYSQMLFSVVGVLSASIDATNTAITWSTEATFSVGETHVIDNEQVYITGTNGTALTVQRAVNGSVGTVHAISATANIVTYPGPISEAVLIQAARLWKRRDSGFASQVGLPETGQFVVFSGGLDADVKTLLAPYVRMAVG